MKIIGKKEALGFSDLKNHPDETTMYYRILGEVVWDLLKAKKSVNRKSICCKLLFRIQYCKSMEEERIFYHLIRLLFGRS